MLRRKLALVTIALLFSTLACRAATRLIFPDTPTPPPPTSTPLPPATLTPTPASNANCSILASRILDDAINFEFDDEEASEKTLLVSYVVTGDALSKPFDSVVPSKYADEQSDRAAQTEIWNYFTRLIPPEDRAFVTAYAIVTDGGGNILASVAQNTSDAKDWILEVDLLDATNKYVLTVTLLHEFGHLLTLNASQVPPNLAIYNNPESNAIYERERKACSTYFPGEGCSLSNSYLNQFFERFWLDLYDEWQSIDAEDDETQRDALIEKFYTKYEEQFLTSYAPTSPMEDIAETLTFFILAPKPEPDSITNRKILFFYEYPELIEMREQILNRLCVEFP